MESKFSQGLNQGSRGNCQVPGATPEVRDGMRFVEVVLSLCSNIHMQKIWPRIEASQESVVYCYDLDVDPLDVHADKNTFHRFDKFNLMYSPCSQSSPREIFLKQDNLIQGGFLAELTKQVLTDLDASKY
ncbi:AMP deaminase [Tanacetum coccineum]